MKVIFMLALLFASLILILLVLVQRGKGGGLAGALGGMGGQSAFGSKAGDTFMRITIGVTIIWFALCLGAVALLKPEGSRFGDRVGSKPAAATMTETQKGAEEGAGTAAGKPASGAPAESKEKPAE